MKKSKENEKKESKKQSKYLDIWEVLKIRKEKGLWNGEIKISQIREFNLNKGDHYFVIENSAKRSIKCISCQISHGGILESRLLTKYRLEKGVLYLEDKATNTTPKDFKPPIDTE